MGEERTTSEAVGDIVGLGEKLRELAGQLPPGEQVALAWLLQRAMAAPLSDDVAGLGMGTTGSGPVLTQATASQLGASLPIFRALGVPQLRPPQLNTLITMWGG